MDVSNASGYDGTTVAADACYVAKHVTGRTRVVVTEATNPQVRQVVEDVRARLRARGRRGAARGRRDRSRRASPTAAHGRGGRDLPAAELLRLPRAGARSRGRRDEAGALPVAHVDPDLARRARGARRATAARSRSARARARATPMSFGGPHYGFLACRAEHVRRMPGRIVGETTDVDGRARLRAHALDARAAHPPREGDVEHHDEPDAARARRPRLPHLARPAGPRELGETCMALAALRAERLAAPGSSRCFRTDNVQGVCRARRTDARATSSRAARERGVHPGYALGRDYPGIDDCAARRRHGEAHAGGHRPARRGARARSAA